MKDNLAVFATSSNDLIFFIFKPYKHYVASAKLEEGSTVKLLRILGNGNHVFVTDQSNNSFIISINQEYAKKPSYEFSIAKRQDFFKVTRLLPQSTNEKIKFSHFVEGDYFPTDDLISNLVFDKEGSIYSIAVDSKPGCSIEVTDLQNYMRSHSFEYKSSVLAGTRCPYLESDLKSGNNTLVVG